GELEHHHVKRFYARTNKRKHVFQIAKHQQKEILDQEAQCQLDRTQDAMDFDDDPEEPLDDTRLDFADEEPLLRTSPKVHYHMSKSQHFCEDITSFVIRNKGDPAFKMFMPSLKDHLLTRLTGRAYNGDEDTFTHKEHNQILFLDNKLYRHKVLRINYTMYDMRHAQDSINPRTHPDVMVLSHEDGEDADQHPYWYTRVVGVFHVNVCYRGPLPISRQPQHMDFLWVRWFGRDLTAPGGFETRRLHRVGFVDIDDYKPFGFLNPDEVLRGVHLIPAFAHG
ncbi:hypothetical protein BKA93DRAFT_727333, partial [Sparassis latifolia]